MQNKIDEVPHNRNGANSESASQKRCLDNELAKIEASNFNYEGKESLAKAENMPNIKKWREIELE